MAHSPVASVIQHLRNAVTRPQPAEDADGVLLARFLGDNDEAAFTALVKRHGPMVLGVGRRVLADDHDAEDVFQATFLVLARRAKALRQSASLASWLYGVALRLSLKARVRASRRHRRETRSGLMSHDEGDRGPAEPCQAGTDPALSAAHRELRTVLDEELGCLPEKYRAPLVLCYLEGLTNEEAAARLQWPVGSVKGRLNRARDLLGNRLTRRGVGLAAPVLGAVLAETASATLPSHLLSITVRAAADFAVGQAVPTTGVSVGAVELTQGALRAMTFHKFKVVAGAIAVLAVLASASVAFFPKGQPLVPVALAADEAPPVFTLPAETPQVKADREAVVKGNTEFAFDLYKQLAQAKDNQGKNLFMSPYSISTALAMAYAGAKGETADEMAKTLHFPVEANRLHPAFAGLIGRFQANKEDKGYQLSVANALWGQKSSHWQKEFLRTAFSNYAAGLRPVDFGATEDTRKMINGWVEEQTKDKIKDLIQPGAIDGDTRMVLTNAIYFKGDWKEQFDKKATQEAAFHISGTKDAKVPMMHRSGDYGYLETADFKALELPYKGDQLAMVVLLPQKVDGLADLEKQLTSEKLASWTGKLTKHEVIVSLPKFKMTCDFSLAGQLQALGMKAPFAGGADFSGMTTDDALYIGAVIHKAFVDVNEEGTEAAAATAVVMTNESVHHVPEFHADHPFLFLLRDKQSGSVLFLGRFSEPAK
jgi:serpin B